MCPYAVCVFNIDQKSIYKHAERLFPQKTALKGLKIKCVDSFVVFQMRTCSIFYTVHVRGCVLGQRFSSQRCLGAVKESNRSSYL